MPRRKQVVKGDAPAYMYEDLFVCEEEGDHQVTTSVWPPPRTGMSPVDPSLSLQCDLCGAWLIVYEGHATGQIGGVTVITRTGEPPSEPTPKAKGVKEFVKDLVR